MNLRFGLSFLLGVMAYSASSQESNPPPLTAGHYIIVAAYRNEQAVFANRYVSDLNRNGHHAKAGFDEVRKFYYVYLDYYPEYNESIREMLKTRKEGNFPTAWVRVIKGDALAKQEPVVVEKKTVAPVKVESEEVKKEAVKPEVPVQQAQVKDSLPKEKFVPITDVVENPKPDPVYRPQILKNTPVFLSLYNPTKNSIVAGEVEVVNTETAKLITRVKGNDYVSLPNPNSKTGQLSLISSAFGYRKMQHEINYKSTEADTLQDFIALVGNYYMIKFDMVRIHSGDISPLYHVYFYSRSAVMKPESKYELNALLQLMQEFPNYHIVLHGHTNGRAAGEIITRGPSNDFFTITPDVNRTTGSAKALSLARAEIIRDWLVASGIATDRMEIKGWGGSRMIHDPNSDDASRNIRVDVEVIKE